MADNMLVLLTQEESLQYKGTRLLRLLLSDLNECFTTVLQKLAKNRKALHRT